MEKTYLIRASDLQRIIPTLLDMVLTVNACKIGRWRRGTMKLDKFSVNEHYCGGYMEVGILFRRARRMKFRIFRPGGWHVRSFDAYRFADHKKLLRKLATLNVKA